MLYYRWMTWEILEGQDNEGGQGETNVMKYKGKPPLPPIIGNARKKKKNLLFRVISLGWKEGILRNLGHLIIAVAQLILMILSWVALQPHTTTM